MKLTKALAKHITQLVIDNNTIGFPMTGQDLAWMKFIHGGPVVAVRRMPNPEYPSDPRHVQVRLKGQEDFEPWSWNKSINAVSERQELHRVMRKAIESDRDEAAEAIEDVCMKCGSREYIQMDHDGKPFVEIADEWLAKFSKNHGEKSPPLEDGPEGIGYQFVHPDDEAWWVLHHAQNVVWQKLCRSCNASKGARHA